MNKKTNAFPAIILGVALLFIPSQSKAGHYDSTASGLRNVSFLVLPYKPMMHLSDADHDIAKYSEMTPHEIRNELRNGLLKNLNTKLVMEYEAKIPDQDFVQQDDRDLELVYSSVAYGQDTAFPYKAEMKKDSVMRKMRDAVSTVTGVGQRSYINVSFYDQQLLPDLARKYSADYFIFLNELDIKTHFDDCLDLALKIYQRELKVHYSVFDRNGKQVFGDAASVKFPSNSNFTDEIINKNFPLISDQIISSVKAIGRKTTISQ
jgi:hypothetical protein